MKEKLLNILTSIYSDNSDASFIRLCRNIGAISNKNFELKTLIETYKKLHNIQSKNNSEILYLIKNDLINIPNCPVCSNKLEYRGATRGHAKYCSRKCSGMSSDRVNNIRKTNLKKHGVPWAANNPETVKKMKKTNLKKYGCENVSQNKKIKDKKREIFIERYGYGSPIEIPENREKAMEKAQSEESRLKRIQTCRVLWGHDHPMQTTEQRRRQSLLNKKVMFEKLKNGDRLSNLVTPLFEFEEYDDRNLNYPWKCNKCGTKFLSNLDDGKIPRCMACFPLIKSGIEQELYEFCLDLDENIMRNDRLILEGMEADIVFLNHKLILELNGLYWHSDANGKDSNYHLTKTNTAISKGYSLIHIFEDEWINKKDIVKSMIKSKLGLIGRKIPARKTEAKLIKSNEASEFLDDNHIQGSCPGRHYGLFHNSELVFVLTVGKARYTKKCEWELLRVCGLKNTVVQGGVSKIYKYFVDDVTPASVLTYADRRFGEGKTYENIGFQFSHHSEPAFFYIKNNFIGRYRREKFQKHKLSKLLETYNEDLSEWQNMQLNGYDRIWDCGCSVYTHYWSLA